jgi:hypothetical protein
MAWLFLTGILLQGAPVGCSLEQPFKALWGAGNEHGQLLCYFFTYSKRLEELRDGIQRYIKRIQAKGQPLPTVVYTDNPDQDTAFFKSLFGDSVIVLKDPFHMLQDMFSTCRKQHSLFHQCMTEASDIIFPLYEVIDLAQARLEYEKHMQRIGEYNDNQQPEDSFFKKHCRRFMVLHTDKAGLEGLKSDLRAWRIRWGTTICATKSYNGMFYANPGSQNSGIDTVLNTLFRLIDNGQIGDPNHETIYIDVTPPGSSQCKYITARGTCQLENTWRRLEELCKGTNTSPTMADAKMLDFICIDNVDRDVRFKCKNEGKALLTTEFDQLVNCVLLSQALGHKPPVAWWGNTDLNVPREGGSEEFGAVRQHHGTYTATAYMAVYDSLGATIIPGPCNEAAYDKLKEEYVCKVRARFPSPALSHTKDSSVLSRGISMAAAPVTTADERLYYAYLEGRGNKHNPRGFRKPGGTVNYEALTREWNSLLFCAIKDDKDTLSGCLYEQQFVIEWARIRPKELSHVKKRGEKVTQTRDSRTGMGGSSDSRRQFRADRKMPSAVRAPPAPRIDAPAPAAVFKGAPFAISSMVVPHTSSGMYVAPLMDTAVCPACYGKQKRHKSHCPLKAHMLQHGFVFGVGGRKSTAQEQQRVSFYQAWFRSVLGSSTSGSSAGAGGAGSGAGNRGGGGSNSGNNDDTGSGAGGGGGDGGGGGSSSGNNDDTGGGAGGGGADGLSLSLLAAAAFAQQVSAYQEEKDREREEASKERGRLAVQARGRMMAEILKNEAQRFFAQQQQKKSSCKWPTTHQEREAESRRRIEYRRSLSDSSQYRAADDGSGLMSSASAVIMEALGRIAKRLDTTAALIACLGDGHCLPRSIAKHCDITPAEVIAHIVRICTNHVDAIESRWPGETINNEGTAFWCNLNVDLRSGYAGLHTRGQERAVKENVWNNVGRGGWCCGELHAPLLAAELQKRIVIFHDSRIKRGDDGYGCQVATPGAGTTFEERLAKTEVRMIPALAAAHPPMVPAFGMEEVLFQGHSDDTIYLVYGNGDSHYNLVDFRPPVPAPTHRT